MIMKIKKHIKKISICAFAIFTMACCFTNKSNNNFKAYASVKQEVTVTNGDFANNPNVTYIETSPSGWNKITNSSATAGIINVNSDSFAKSTYYLDKNPEKKSTTIDDDKILMINSKNADGSQQTNQGYKSNDISLDANSYYIVSILAKTINNARGSIYVTGLEDYKDENSAKFEKITTNDYWEEYKFYIATEQSKTVNLELWLGSNANENYQSSDAVFFDEVQINKISNDLFNETTNAKQKVINYQNENIVAITNANFETGDLTNWTKAELSDSLGGYGKVINISSNDVMLSYGLLPLGTDLTKNNTFGLVISNNNASAVGYKLSSPVALGWGDYLKVSANVKVSENMSGNAYVVIRENDDVRNFQTNLGIDNEEKLYNATTNKLSINSNSSDKFKNNYQTVTFYLKGHNFYNTSFSVEFWLGYNDEENKETAVGYAVFDNLKIENISGEEYKSATTSTYVSKIEYKTTSEKESFTNGEFNSFSKNEKTLTYPYKAEDWNVVSSNEEQTVAGVININNDIYNNIKPQIGNIANPGHKNTGTNDTNNIMMLWNKSAQAQSIQSNSFTVSEEKYYNLNFNFKTLATTSNTNLVNVEVLDNDNNVVFVEKNINSLDIWKNYSLLVRAEKASSSLSIRISLGFEENKASGYLFIDNVKLTEITALENYNEYVENNHVIDFTSGKFNLKSYEKNSHDYYTPLAYNGNAENGSVDHAIAGVIDAKENNTVELNPNNTNALKNMLVIETFNHVTYSFTSKDTISLTADKYYQFDIDIKTILEDNNLEYEEDYYGAEFSLVNIENSCLKAIKADDYTNYTIFVKAVASKDTNLRFAMKTIDTDTAGFAFFDNYKMTEISESTYLSMQETYKEDATKLFTETAKDEEDEEEKEETNNQFDFLLIPSIIIGLALVIAIVGSILKRVRFKKWTKKKQAEYDRNKTLHRDVIRKEAEEKRDEQVRKIKEQKNALEEKIKELEDEHQEKLKNNRRRVGHRTLDKQTEKEFKQYAKTHTNMQKKLELLNSDLEKMQTDEYLIKLQNKLFADNLKNKLNGKANLETQPLEKEKSSKSKRQKNKELYSKKNKQ